MAVKSLIETVTVGAGGAASIEFAAIPQDGSDLVLKFSIRDSAGQQNAIVLFNGAQTATNLVLFGSGSSVFTYDTADGYDALYIPMPRNTTTANTFGNASVYVSNYTTTSSKSISSDAVTENNSTEAYQQIASSLYGPTSPITSIKINSAVAQYSTASLYKIKYD